ncbi:hypothetical protein BC826DRAFT_576696 [Russula brevipes]|nr:hypothetical protein BC826DRAFT_576696 [Russula brevipes]
MNSTSPFGAVFGARCLTSLYCTMAATISVNQHPSSVEKIRPRSWKSNALFFNCGGCSDCQRVSTTTNTNANHAPSSQSQSDEPPCLTHALLLKEFVSYVPIRTRVSRPHQTPRNRRPHRPATIAYSRLWSAGAGTGGVRRQLDRR